MRDAVARLGRIKPREISLHVGDMTTETRWPDWTGRAGQAGARSSLSIGLPVHATVGGALNLYATEPDVFDDDAGAVAQAFVVLTTTAQDSGRTIRQTARSLVGGTTETSGK